MRVPQKHEAAKSQRWMQTAVRDYSDFLNSQICSVFDWSQNEELEWLSPLASDEYAEYRDTAFLERLGVTKLQIPLYSFWPDKGPCWDALARTSSGKLLIIEAKAHIGEGLPDATSAKSERSIEQIRRSLAEAKRAFRASEKGSWESPFYQYANRLAHLYFMRELNDLDAYLLFLYFAEAPDVADQERTTHAEWLGAKRVFNHALGIPARHQYSSFVQTIICSVPEMLSFPQPTIQTYR